VFDTEIASPATESVESTLGLIAIELAEGGTKVLEADSGFPKSKQVISEVVSIRASKVNLAQKRSEEHTSDLQSHHDLVCRLLLEKKNRHTAT